MVWSGCEAYCWQIHEVGWRIIRDMPILGDSIQDDARLHLGRRPCAATHQRKRAVPADREN
jgi:hypothetical protein